MGKLSNSTEMEKIKMPKETVRTTVEGVGEAVPGVLRLRLVGLQ